MKKLLACLFLALSLPGYSQSPQTPPSDETTAAITTLREGLIDSFNKGDIDKLLTYLDPDAVVTWQNGEICKGPDEVKAFYQRMMTGDNRIVREVKAAPEVTGRHVYGDWGVSWGNLHDHFVLMDGRDLQMNSTFTATIAKRGDRWLVVAFHTSVNAFDNPVMSLAIHKTGMWIGIAGAVAGLLLGLLIGCRKKHA